MRTIARNIKILCALLLVMIGFAFTTTINEEKSYKCLIQLSNYTGEGAYVVVSLVDKDGNYEKTVQVLGPDEDWYNEISSWWKFYGKKRADIDAITGASITAGGRKMLSFTIDASKVNAGYSLRFETAVEDDAYHKEDVVISLEDEKITTKTAGKGFIRFVKLIAN